jgi:hypothetical protein
MARIDRISRKLKATYSDKRKIITAVNNHKDIFTSVCSVRRTPEEGVIKLSQAQVQHLNRSNCIVLCSQRPRQSGEVVGEHRQNEGEPHPFDAAIDGVGHATAGLCPVESLFDPLAMLH